AGDVTLTATDNSRITADAGGFAVSVSISATNVALASSVGLGFGNNDILGETRAVIDSSTVTAGGDVRLDAASAAAIAAFTFGGPAAVSFSGDTFAGSLVAAGAFSNNTIANTTEASILNTDDPSSVTSQHGSVALHAQDSAQITAIGIGGSLALAGAANPVGG